MTTPCALREVLVQAAVAQSLAWARSASRLGASYGAKSDLVTPHSGQAQSSGMSQKRVPAASPLSGSPSASL
jgi:hypothetical protein